MQALQYECAFHFPAMHRHSTVISLQLHGRLSSTHAQPPPVGRGVPFQTSREDPIFVCWMHVIGIHWTRIPGLLLCVPASTILAHLTTQGEAGRRLAWDKWGPKGTRMDFGYPHSAAGWASCASGQSFVQPMKTEMSPTSIIKMDFHRTACKFFSSHANPPDAHGESAPLSAILVSEPSVLDLPDVFIAPVCTTLPYIRRSKTLEERFDMAMLCDDAIVLASYDNVS